MSTSLAGRVSRAEHVLTLHVVMYYGRNLLDLWSCIDLNFECFFHNLSLSDKLNKGCMGHTCHNPFGSRD